MRHALIRHATSEGDAVSTVDVQVARNRAQLFVCYIVKGTIGELSLPPLAKGIRADELWRHTCFEAFLNVPTETAYYEFNFAPSGNWAAYRFETYRAGTTIVHEIVQPRVESHLENGWYEFQVALNLSGLPNALWRVGISAVIENLQGRKSYWALKHPIGRPDFHHSVCFALELPAA